MKEIHMIRPWFKKTIKDIHYWESGEKYECRECMKYMLSFEDVTSAACRRKSFLLEDARHADMFSHACTVLTDCA